MVGTATADRGDETRHARAEALPHLQARSPLPAGGILENTGDLLDFPKSMTLAM